MSEADSNVSTTPLDSSDPILAQLCQCYGIESVYDDVWGNTQTVPATVLLDLLRSMGVACETSQQRYESVLQCEAQSDELLLSPVLVRVEHEQLLIPVRLRPPDFNSHADWLLTEETGEVHRDSVSVGDPTGISDQHFLLMLELNLKLAPGYHSLRVTLGQRTAQLSLIITPQACYVPEALQQQTQPPQRWWGLAAQVYSLRSQTDCGIGDFSTLAELIRVCDQRGAAFLGVSPLHAMYPGRPEHRSPYSPSSRLFLNTLYIDITGCEEVKNSHAASALLASEELRRTLAEVRISELVDYERVGKVKLQVLELAFEDFCASPIHSRYARFQRFCAEQGHVLLQHAIYEALAEHFHTRLPKASGWQEWPEDFRTPDSAAVLKFAREHAERVDFYRWLQWLADEQLSRVSRLADHRALPLGLYQDLAVGVDAAGAETWSHQHLYVQEAAIGAPPDLLNTRGQNWGLPPQHPRQMIASGYTLFIDTLRRLMRYSGAIRIDHVMGLRRLYWIPAGHEAYEGAYVQYPFQDLLGLVALESQRNRCMVIGEDLGTVTDEIRHSLQARGILSYRLLYFEQQQGHFSSADQYPPQALTAINTHDLPTFAGWWQGRDIDWHRRLDHYRDAAALHQAEREREHERRQLWQALREQTWPGDSDEPIEEPVTDHVPVLAAHRFLARTPAMLQLVQLEDLLGLTEQSNLPGTVDEHPNWRRRLPVNVSDLKEHPLFERITGEVAAERGVITAAAYKPAASLWPHATYRLQLHSDFTLAHARNILPYLTALGISHVYTSPYLQSRAGSRHGYDVVDHQRMDSEIGSATDFSAWLQTLREQRLGQVVDIVPNHMAIGTDNHWWMDVLEHGQASLYVHYFDIDWQPPERVMRGKLLLPVLGEFYGDALEQQRLRLHFDQSDGRFRVQYYDQCLPLDPREYDFVLNYPPDTVPANDADTGETAEIFNRLGAAFRRLPGRVRSHWQAVQQRYRQSELLRLQLLSVYRQTAANAALLEQKIEAVNRGPGLHQLLERQPWRLAHWRTASDEINYRRFFDNNDLAAVRVEAEDVFAATHSRILEWVADGLVQGLRVDHPDGLYDPAGYFQRLAQRSDEVRAEDGDEAEELPPLYVVVEKILAVDEPLPEDWCVAGTTGYDFSSLVNGLWVNPAAVGSLTFTYTQFVGRETGLEDLIYHCKKLVMRRLLASELRVLTNRLYRLAHANPKTRDFTRGNLQEALKEFVACFPVYRSYINGNDISQNERHSEVNTQDVAHIRQAMADARRRSNVADLSVFDFISRIILQQRSGSDVFRQQMLDFTLKLQQFTAPVMAKAVEDTAFYRYHRLISLNDVGDEPLRVGVPLAAFHRANQQRLQDWPHTMLNTSSHDSKRSEDVRARLNVITEIPREWRLRVKRWHRLNEHCLQQLAGTQEPSRNDEYLLYQTLLGSLPLQPMNETDWADYRARIHAYMEKAVREGKQYTSWIAPDEDYEHALHGFIDQILDVELSRDFMDDLLSFKDRIATAGLVNSLGQVVLKLTVPGVPDIYQGMELWGFHLVDPDNRRPVDYTLRQQLLAQLGEPGSVVPPATLLADLHSGLIKLYVTRQLLHVRQQHPQLFDHGEYLPLHGAGTFADHLCGFARIYQGQVLLVLVPRWTFAVARETRVVPVAEHWQETFLELPPLLQQRGGVMINVLSGERLPMAGAMPVSQLLADLPVAVFLLQAESEPESEPELEPEPDTVAGEVN